MSNLINHILCPNYEDYETLTPARNYLKHFPDMWVEEKYAEAALWRERCDIMKNRPLFFTDYMRWWKNHIPKDIEGRMKQRQRLEYALYTLAQDYKWKVKNLEDVLNKGVSRIYCTRMVDAREIPDEELPKPKQKPAKPRIVSSKGMTRGQLQSFVLDMLAQENEYKKKGAGKWEYNGGWNKRIYQIS